MQKRIIIAFFLVVLLIPAMGQEKLNFKTVDVKSYELYLAENWKELIDYTSQARKQGIDFYYLQMRTGIAYYNLGKYRAANKWFLKAWENDHSSELLQEYLYFSLIYSGRIFEARKYTDQFSESVKSKLLLKRSKIMRVAYETGFVFNSDFEALKGNSLSGDIELGSDYGETNLLKDYTFHSVDLNHQVFSNLSVNHNFTYIDVNREATVDWVDRYASPIKVHQFQYYVNPVWVIGKKLNVSPSLNLIFGNGETYIGGYDNAYEKVFTMSKFNFSEYVASISLWSDFENLSPGLEFNIGEIGADRFTQASAWATYYPFSNTSLYLTPKVYFKSGGFAKDFGWNAFGVSAGGQLGKLHLNAQYIFGEMQDFVESGGYLISNFPGQSDQKSMASVYYSIGKNIHLVFRYINQSVTEDYRIYSSGLHTNTFKYNYTKHSITGGISWLL